MKTLLCFFVMWTIVLSGRAQSDFEKTFDFSMGDYLTDMILTSDNNLLLCGNTTYGILVIKTDLNGEVIWQKDFNWSVNAVAYDICESPTHFYYLSGFRYPYDAIAMKLNKNGDYIASRIDNGELYFERNNFAIESVGSEIIISQQVHTYYNSGYTKIFKTDSLFNFYVNYGTYDNIQIHNLFVINSDWYFMGFEPGTSNAFIEKAYSFQNDYSFSEPCDLFVAENGSIYFSFWGSEYSGSIKKTNEEGEVLWTSTIFNEGHNAYSIRDYKSKLIATGAKSNEYFFSIIDTTDGTVDTTFLFNDYDTQFGNAIAISGDDLFIAGSFKESASFNDYDIFLNKYSLDTLLTAIDKKEKVIVKLKVYPNPAKDRVVFEFPGSAMRPGDRNAITISDVSGRLVEEIEIIGNETTWDCRHLPNGIYFYQFKTTEKSRPGKFLIIK